MRVEVYRSDSAACPYDDLTTNWLDPTVDWLASSIARSVARYPSLPLVTTSGLGTMLLRPRGYDHAVTITRHLVVFDGIRRVIRGICMYLIVFNCS